MDARTAEAERSATWRQAQLKETGELRSELSAARQAQAKAEASAHSAEASHAGLLAQRDASEAAMQELVEVSRQPVSVICCHDNRYLDCRFLRDE